MNDFFSTHISKEQMKILEDNNLSLALDFLRRSQDKIVFSLLDLNGYYHVLQESKKKYSEWNEILFKERRISGHPNNSVNYLSTTVPANVLLDKINTNYFSSLHSFFDNYAHFLFVCLYPSEILPKRLYFHTFYNKLVNDQQATEIKTKIEEYLNKSAFQYINDIDNINKHRGSISPNISIMLDNGEHKIEIPEFDKDENPHPKHDMIDIMEECHELIIAFYNNVTKQIFEYLKD